MNRSDEWILGLGGSSHDFSAALACGHDIRVAIEAERLSRRKHGQSWWFQNPVKEAVDYCLGAENLHIDQVAAVVSSDMLPSRAREGFPGIPFALYRHHRCHAASAAMMVESSTRAAIIVYDGMGSVRSTETDRTTRETFGFYLLEDDMLTCLGETLGQAPREDDSDFPRGCTNSMGHIYELVTGVLGFSEFQEGKTMGLAAYGRPRFLEMLLPFVEFHRDMNRCFESDPVASGLPIFLEDLLLREGDSFSVRADLAASVQALMNQTLLHCWNLIADTEPDVVCLAGGCALNSVSNGALAVNLPDGCRIVVPPHAGDTGIGFGAIWLHRQLASNDRIPMTIRQAPLNSAIACPGRTYDKDACELAVAKAYPKLALDGAVAGPAELAARLATGELIGIFQGGSEIGPRALGGRSILADPRHATTRERLNREIKQRELFRPFAPVVLADAYDQYFADSRQMDAFMLKVAKVTDRCRKEAPAVVHVDDSARVQCVSKESNPFLEHLLREFAALTGVPILLNTSFNRRGEPIVETPEDAVDCFLGLGLDGLFIEGRYYFKLYP